MVKRQWRSNDFQSHNRLDSLQEYLFKIICGNGRKEMIASNYSDLTILETFALKIFTFDDSRLT